MPPSRNSLLELLEDMYGARHPDFDSIRRAFEQVIRRSEEESKKKDAKLLLAGLRAVEHTYEDWDELSNYQRQNAMKAVRRIRDKTVSTLEKHGVDLHRRDPNKPMRQP